MKFTTRLCLLTFLIPSVCFTQNWFQITDFPGTQRDDGAFFVIGDTAFCGTGNLPWGNGTIDFYALDLNNDSWSTVASLPLSEERQYACGFSSSNFGFIFGGFSAGIFMNDVWMYNPITNLWAEKTALPDVGRSGSTSFVIEDTAYIVGGKTLTDNAIDEVWAYDMTNDSWQQKNNLPFGTRWRAASTILNNRGYLIFGRDNANIFCEQLYEYDPVLDSWNQISTFPGIGRTYSSLISISGDLVLLTGYDSLGNSYNDVWRYKLLSGNWDQLNSIPSTERRGGMCFTYGSVTYYTTGINQTHVRLKETWKNINPVELLENPDEENFQLFPNPTQNNVTLMFGSTINSNKILSLKICDLSGKILYSNSEIDPTNSIEINLENFNPGIYLVQVQTLSALLSQKLILQ